MQPGWRNSGPEHWQSQWERRLGPCAQRVQQRDWEHPIRKEWLASLHAALEAQPGPSILIAHSVGCLSVAELLSTPGENPASRHAAAAVLVAPADVERDGAARELGTFRPIPMKPLAVRALVIASSNDPYCAPARAQAMARAWDADFRLIAGAGHINNETGYGPWPEGWLLVEQWLVAQGLQWPVPHPKTDSKGACIA